MYICKECGSNEVQIKEWVELNSGKNMGACDSSNEPEDNWCPECEEHCVIIDKED